MKFIADLHIHSKYSRATSRDLVLEEIDRVADEKGVDVIATGDFTHPQWFKEIEKKLEPIEKGFLKLKKEFQKPTIKGNFANTRFVLSGEISLIYSKNGKTRRIHLLILLPSIEAVKKLNDKLSIIGNLKSDGRPILGLDSEKLAEIVFKIDENAIIIPAHIWTPWFSLFGSMSGFDSIEECFGKMTDKIYALETGLSSDPLMNWQLSKLDKFTLVSNSDSHSLSKIGREANIFEAEFSYFGILDALKNSNPSKLKNKAIKPKNYLSSTIEFFPQEGKYYNDGHRNCLCMLTPEQSKSKNLKCPKCGKLITIGVLHRILDLSDRKISAKLNGNFLNYDNFVPYYNLVGLEEIIKSSLGVKTFSKKAQEKYNEMIIKFGSELNILLNISEVEIENFFGQKIAQAMKNIRSGNINIKGGYDGQYGEIKIFKV